MERRWLLMATLGLSAFAVAARLGALVDLAATSELRDMDAWLITGQPRVIKGERALS